MEFTFVMLPLFCLLFVLLDIGWSIFVKSTLQRAVRVAVRWGITIDSTNTNKCLTDAVKSTVQLNALGLLSGTNALTYVKVHYFLPPAPATNTAPLDVSSTANADAPGNIMQVSVEGYPVLALVPRTFNWRTTPDTSPVNLTVYAADIIEPTRNPACVGSAP